MPETRERDPKHNFMDFVEMFFIPIWEEPREGDITIIGTPPRSLQESKDIC